MVGGRKKGDQQESGELLKVVVRGYKKNRSGLYLIRSEKEEDRK